MKLIAIAFVLLLTGCVSFNRNGTTHHVIIGFGIISENNTNQMAAKVVKVQALGIGLSDGLGTQFSLGYNSTTTVSVRTNQNLLIEVSDVPGKPLTVTVPK